MKKLLIPALALFVSHAAAVAQQNLTLVIDQDAHTLDWLGGSTITRTPGLFDNNAFGAFMISPTVIIDSPLLGYSGAGAHTSIQFEMTQDRQGIYSILLGVTAPPGEGAVFSGTAEGPAGPTFTSGDWSRFASLNRGEYTLNAVGPWGGGIHVVVVPEPATWAFLGLGLGAAALVRARRQRS